MTKEMTSKEGYFPACSAVRATSSSEERLRFFARMLDAVEQAVIATDIGGVILYWNRFAEQLYGWTASEVTGMNVADVLMPEARRAEGHELISKWPEGTRTPGEWHLRRRDGSPVIVRASPTPILDENGEIVGVVGVSWDIAQAIRLEEERRRTEEVLRKNQWQLIEAQKLAHVGSWERDLETDVITLSGECARMFFGDERHTVTTYAEIARMVRMEDRERMRMREESAETGTGDVEFRVERADGSVLDIHGRFQVVRDASGRPIRRIGANLDITERRRVEAELREKRRELQHLSRRLLEAQETERRFIARELHDDFGQLLTAIRMNLEASGQTSERLNDSIALVDQAIERVRTLALDLRPSILDDLGLVAALRWLLSRQSQRAGFRGEFRVSGSDARLPAAVGTCCFRLAQEALTNAARHAAAGNVAIQLDIGAEEIELVVRDDGRGFDVALARERAAHGASLGLLSMQERVSLAGGKLELQSTLGKGTTVSARFPLGDLPGS